MRPLLFLIVAAGFAASAGADARKDAQIEVTPGMWNWKQETNIVGFQMKEDNLECLIPEKATILLSGLARDLDEGCTVDNVLPATGGYSFQLICKGDIPGKADATLTHTPKSMIIKAKGSAKFLGLPAGFSMTANATYAGECPADELARQKQKYAEDVKAGKG